MSASVASIPTHDASTPLVEEDGENDPHAALQLTDAQRSMTVEEYLTSVIEDHIKMVQSRCKDGVKQLRETFEHQREMAFATLAAKKKGSRQAATIAAAAATVDKEEDPGTSAAAAAAASSGTAGTWDVKLVVSAGPHVGEEFVVKPRYRRKAPKVGRSTGKEYTSGGVSLPEDGEVSTSHACFQAKDGLVFFKDVGSTNGSQLNGRDVAANVPEELCDGDELRVGATVMAVRLLAAASDGKAKKKGTKRRRAL